jgi:ABC-type antimicrobial peptide transport system permease subunit
MAEGSRTWLVLVGIALALAAVAGVGTLLGGGTESYVSVAFAVAAAGVGAYLGRRIGNRL